MWENGIILIIVIAAAAYIAHRFYRNLSGRSSGCGCSCTGCDMSKNKGKQPDRNDNSGDNGCCSS